MSTPENKARPASEWLAGGGEMGKVVAAMDWSKTALGPIEFWPQSLRTTVSLCLASNFPISIAWGPQRTQIYNDGYWPICGAKHPGSMGQDFKQCWFSAWPAIGEAFESASAGRTAFLVNQRMFLDRYGYLEETFFTFSFSPIRDESGGVAGLFHPVTELTQQSLAERRLKVLRAVADRTVEAKTVASACELITQTLAEHELDVPFALLYLLDADGKRATLSGSAGLPRATPLSPEKIDLEAFPQSGWPLAEAASGRQPLQVDQLDERFGSFACGPYPEHPKTAFVLPVHISGLDHPFSLVVAGVSSRRTLDEPYRTFYFMLREAVTNALTNARAYEEERKRAEALAELDRAKTAFFSNVSHEFRTPLTLMLGPLEDLLAKSDGTLPPDGRERLEIAHRNSLRLLKLVNSLLDFSRIESGRMQASYEPTDLSSLTAELASVFRSAIERAGLRLLVNCAPLAEPAYVDHEMWEKIVLNLLSNAFKFTFEGDIEVSLRDAGDRVEMSVRDTGTGIPAEELPNVFERFHRVKGAPGRTFEGSGIGLALVQELVKLHGGTVRLESELNRGSTFTVDIPKGRAHLPADRIGAPRTLASTGVRGEAYVEEALRWLPDQDVSATESTAVIREPVASSATAASANHSRILLADDNADMREYLRRLLSQRYQVEAVADGMQALQAAERRTPDLVLADVMMPHLDGFGLLTRLRAAENTKTTPIILLSARAGEESRVEGMEAGADDYLVKPFSARELMARVAAHLEIARVRKDSEKRLRDSEARFRNLADHAPVMVWVTEPDASCTFVSRSWYEFTGQTPETSLGFGWLDAIHPDDRKYSEKTFLAANQRRESLQLEYRLRRKDGEYRWAIDSAKPRFGDSGEFLGYIGSVMDITERKEMEEALREKEERLRTAGAAGDVGTWRVDLRTSLDTRDAGLNRLLGLATVESTQPVADFFDRVHPDDRARVRELIGNAIRERGQYYAECRIVRPDGQVRWLLDQGKVICGPDGEPRFLTGAAVDITQRKQMEDALRETDRRKDEFLAMLAHELRNPLAPIRNAAEVLKLATPGDANQRWVRDVVERQTQHLTRLVDDLLDVSRITRNMVTLRSEEIELANVIERAVEASRPLIDARRHRLAVSLPPDPVRLQGDLTRLVQVVGNLLNNAAKYTREGGHIWVDVTREDGQAAIYVRDNGIGIPADLLPHVFDLFTQTDRSLDRSQGGLGLGLTLVRRLVEMHGGQVEARSAGAGLGSEFTVRLPALAPVAAAGAREPETQPSVSASQAMKILVVEDNLDSAEMMSLMLKLGGYEVRTAYNGGDALEAARAFQPDAILCDIGLPGMNGFEVAERLRELPAFRRTPLIALTGYGQEESRRRAREAGFDHHLVKPVEPDALGALLDSLRQSA